MTLPLTPETGMSIGRWTVLALIPGRRHPVRVDARVRVRCVCGTEAEIDRSSLVRGHSTSCGCLARELTSARSREHGHSVVKDGRQVVSPEYRSWLAAKTRVTNPRDAHWPRYGGRGIRMAAEWLHDSAAFLAHVGPRPAGHTLDRIDPDGDYAPGNVRWATPQQQRHNRSTRHAAS